MLTSVVLTRACEGGSGYTVAFVGPLKLVNKCMSLKRKKNAHARFSNSCMYTPMFFGPTNRFLGDSCMCTQDPAVCTNAWVAHTVVFQSANFPTHTLGRATIGFSFEKSQNKTRTQTAFFANSRIRYLTQRGLFFGEKWLIFIILE